MGYVKEEQFKKIELPSDAFYWVEVSTDFTYGEIKGLGTDLEGVEASDKFLQLAIKKWNLDAEDGTILDITPENIDLLKKDDVLAIIADITGEVGGDTGKKERSTS